MPAKRGIVAARNVPPSRLPLGTPTVTMDRPRTSSHTTQHSSSDLGAASDTPTSVIASSATDMVDSTVNTAALAQGKLRRQQERIQQAEAALHHPPPVEALRPRGVAKSSGKPLDTHDRAAQRAQDSEGAVEVRVNKYPAPSRDHSLSRSLSSDSQTTITQNTANVGGAELDADSQDDSGFQVWTRRGARGMRAVGDGNAYTDKPVIERQKTVEAAFDENETLEVFKQALPSPDFLGTFPGSINGQVQFVQHPNGDVAAHMWSSVNWIWDNIGHFSNIRKRTEGQLAGEGLKGETAYQKLQQHTLAYFRILAKQREATVTGSAFGQENIKSALPEPLLESFPKRLTAADPPKERFNTRPLLQVPSRPTPADPRSQPFIPGSSIHERRYEIVSDSTPTREALRDQLHKTVDIATKRSLSQANIARTVLHDPMQASRHDEQQRYDPNPPAVSGTYVSPYVSTPQQEDNRAGLQNVNPSWETARSVPNAQLPGAHTASGFTFGSVPDMNDFAQALHDGYWHPDMMMYTAQGFKRKSYDEELRDWWTGGSKFARHEELFQMIMKSAPQPPQHSAALERLMAIGSGCRSSPPEGVSGYNETTTRLFIPIYENLAAHVQGPPQQRHDYWCRWSQPPDWCVDRGPNGNHSFYDHNWGHPPARIGRDPRYRRDRADLQFGNLSPLDPNAIGSPGGHPMSMGMGRYGYGRY